MCFHKLSMLSLFNLLPGWSQVGNTSAGSAWRIAAGETCICLTSAFRQTQTTLTGGIRPCGGDLGALVLEESCRPSMKPERNISFHFAGYCAA
jgi:hypothetical protein